VVHGEIEDKTVDFLGGDPGLDLRDQHIETLGYQPARLAHAREGVGFVDLDLPCLAKRRCRGVYISHSNSLRREDELPAHTTLSFDIFLRAHRRVLSQLRWA